MCRQARLCKAIYHNCSLYSVCTECKSRKSFYPAVLAIKDGKPHQGHRLSLTQSKITNLTVKILHVHSLTHYHCEPTLKHDQNGKRTATPNYNSRERIVLPNRSLRHPVRPYSEISPPLCVTAVKCLVMQEHVISKPSVSRGRYKPWLEAFPRLATNVFGRATIHEARGKLDVGLDKFYLRCKAITVLGPRRVCLVDCHREKRRKFQLFRHSCLIGETIPLVISLQSWLSFPLLIQLYNVEVERHPSSKHSSRQMLPSWSGVLSSQFNSKQET